MSQQPQISAVVCTHNRVDFLQRCIDSLRNQTLDPLNYEILVVDNGSIDGTEQLCERYEDVVNFRYIHEPVLGLSQARNRGLQEASGDFIGYIDDDAAAEPQWNRRLASHRQSSLRDSKIRLAGLANLLLQARKLEVGTSRRPANLRLRACGLPQCRR